MQKKKAPLHNRYSFKCSRTVYLYEVLYYWNMQWALPLELHINGHCGNTGQIDSYVLKTNSVTLWEALFFFRLMLIKKCRKEWINLHLTTRR